MSFLVRLTLSTYRQQTQSFSEPQRWGNLNGHRQPRDILGDRVDKL